MCDVCEGKGLVVLNWSDAPQDYAICLCSVGMQMRVTRNAGRETGYALWQVWAAREQVDPSRIVKLEDVATAEEMAALGLSKPADVGGMDREARLLAAGKSRRAKL